MAVLPRGHPLARSASLKVLDLADQPFIMYSSISAFNLRAHVMFACQAAGFNPSVRQEAVQVQTVIGLVESGLGVALVPSVSHRHAPDGVVFLPLHAATELGVALAVVTRPQAATSPARHFKELLEGLKDTAPMRMGKATAPQRARAATR